MQRGRDTQSALVVFNTVARMLLKTSSPRNTFLTEYHARIPRQPSFLKQLSSHAVDQVSYVKLRIYGRIATITVSAETSSWFQLPTQPATNFSSFTRNKIPFPASTGIILNSPTIIFHRRCTLLRARKMSTMRTENILVIRIDPAVEETHPVCR
jgi:uncharacterized membrane protein YfhO